MDEREALTIGGLVLGAALIAVGLSSQKTSGNPIIGPPAPKQCPSPCVPPGTTCNPATGNCDFPKSCNPPCNGRPCDLLTGQCVDTSIGCATGYVLRGDKCVLVNPGGAPGTCPSCPDGAWCDPAGGTDFACVCLDLTKCGTVPEGVCLPGWSRSQYTGQCEPIRSCDPISDPFCPGYVDRGPRYPANWQFSNWTFVPNNYGNVGFGESIDATIIVDYTGPGGYVQFGFDGSSICRFPIPSPAHWVSSQSFYLDPAADRTTVYLVTTGLTFDPGSIECALECGRGLGVSWNVQPFVDTNQKGVFYGPTFYGQFTC